MNGLKLFIFSLIIICMSSCSMNLEDIPFSDDAELLGFKFETREVDVRTIYVTINGEQKQIEEEYVVFTQAHSLDDVMIDSDNKTVKVKISNPDIDITNIVGIASITPGAKIEPINNSPKLGTMADFSIEREYKITSASGTNVSYWKVQAVY